MCEILPLVLVELAPASTAWDERKEEFSLFFVLKNVHKSPTYWGGSWCQWDRGQQLGSGLQHAVCGSLQEKKKRDIKDIRKVQNAIKKKKSFSLKGLITEGKGVVFSCGSRKEEGHESVTTFDPIQIINQPCLGKGLRVGGLTALFFCSHHWHNCKSSEGEALPQAASGFQQIKKDDRFNLRGLKYVTHVSSAPKHRSLTSLNLQVFTCGHKDMATCIWGGEKTSIQVWRLQRILTVNQCLLSLWTCSKPTAVRSGTEQARVQQYQLRINCIISEGTKNDERVQHRLENTKGAA